MNLTFKAPHTARARRVGSVCALLSTQPCFPHADCCLRPDAVPGLPLQAVLAVGVFQMLPLLGIDPAASIDKAKAVFLTWA